MARHTAKDLITAALKASGAVGTNDIPSGEEIANGLDDLHNLIDVWNLEGLWPPSNVEHDVTLTAGQATYSVGNYYGNEDILITRPDRIIAIGEQTSSGYVVLDEVDRDEWATHNRPATSNAVGPMVWMLNPTSPDSTLTFYPAPSSDTSIRITAQAKIMQFKLDDAVLLPPGYWPAIMYGLAEIFASTYGSDLEPRMVGRAMQYKNSIKTLNYQPTYSSYDGPRGQGYGGYDIYTDKGA